MQPQLRRRALDVAGVVEVGLEREHELLVAAVQQPLQTGRHVLERGRRQRRQQPVRAQLVPARDALSAFRGRAQGGERAAIGGGRLGQLADRVTLADVRRRRWTLCSASASWSAPAAACTPTTHVARPSTSPQSACLTGIRARKRSSASPGELPIPTHTTSGRGGT